MPAKPSRARNAPDADFVRYKVSLAHAAHDARASPSVGPFVWCRAGARTVLGCGLQGACH